MQFFRTLLNCCAGFRFYRTLLPLHPLQSIKFLAAVIFLVVLIQIGTLIPVLWQAVGVAGANWVQYNLPRFEIENGQAHYDAPEPFVLTNAFALIVLDTSATRTNWPTYTRPYGLFIGRDQIQFGIAYPDKEGGFGPPRESVVPIKEYPDGVVNADYIRRLAKPWLWRVAPYGVVVYFFGWMLAVLIQAYIFTLVISFAESATLRRFGFNEFFNIAAHACAPAVIVVTTLLVSRAYHFEWLMIAFLGTYFVYVMGATAACRRSEDDEDTDRDELL